LYNNAFQFSVVGAENYGRKSFSLNRKTPYFGCWWGEL